MHEINIGGAERKICLDCVDMLRVGGKTEELKKVGHRTVYRMEALEEDEEELDETVLGDGGEDSSIVPVVYSCGTVSVS